MARSWRARLLGLADLSKPPDGWAVLFPHCRSVHTFGMRFPIDVVFLDRWGWPIEVRHAVKPWRVVACGRAAAVVELAAGRADEHFVVRY